ncbi:hypothetical protein Cadr_000016414, partial [Camelus dromedarius]
MVWGDSGVPGPDLSPLNGRNLLALAPTLLLHRSVTPASPLRARPCWGPETGGAQNQ